MNKPQGITSFQALKTVKNRLGTKRVGHTGTLDKFATGILVILAGRLTRLAVLFSELDKSYLATFTFGRQTDTLDPYGRLVAQGTVPDLERIKMTAGSLKGKIEQTPPDYSAVHVRGKRAYQISRTGQKPELKSRLVTIHRLDMLSYNPPQLEVAVKCSKGTYIRSLARDLGAGMNTCAYVNRLCRTGVGDFRVEEAVDPDDFNPERDLIPPDAFIHRLAGIESLTLKGGPNSRVLNGSPLMDNDFLEPPRTDGIYAVFNRMSQLLAIFYRKDGRYRKKL